MSLEDKLYSPDYWIGSAWSPQWVRDLPPEYWRRMVDAVVTHWFALKNVDDIPGFMAGPEARRVVADQTFRRLYGACDVFIPWLEAVLRVDGARVLELGGGAGSATAALLRAGAKVTSVDISKKYLAISRERLEALGLSGTLVEAPEDWLASEDKAASVLEKFEHVDIVVCFALLEHLLIPERLCLLRQLRQVMRRNPKCKLVIWETPNRLAPVDWHTTKISFPDIVPDELAAEYLRLHVPADAVSAQTAPWTRGEAGRHAWARMGRGVSFHEFDVALGAANYKVIQDGYWGKYDMRSFMKPNLDYERALGSVFASLSPPVHRGFCRPSLDLIIELTE